MKTYTIDVSIIGKFEEKLMSFKKKFAKYGNGEIVYEVSEPYTIKNSDHRSQLVVDITVDASYKISGYSFVALLEMTQNGNLVKKASDDVVVPPMYRDRCECDHCKSNRIRKYTVLLHNESTDEYIQVGKGCVKDYLGNDMSDYASYLSFFSNLDEEVDGLRERFPGCTPSFKFEEILAQTIERVDRFGYISKSKSYDCGVVATSTAVYAALNNCDINGESFEVYKVSAETIELVEKIREFIRNLDDTSDYAHNLKVLESMSYIENKNLGLVVSAVATYSKAMADKKEKETTIPSEYIGNVGGKIEFTAIPECICTLDGMYGLTFIYKMMIGSNVVIWKTNRGLEQEETSFKATIKEHSEYRGVKQTVITRARVLA